MLRVLHRFDRKTWIPKHKVKILGVTGMIMVLLLSACSSTNEDSELAATAESKQVPTSHSEGADMENNQSTATSSNTAKLKPDEIPTALLAGKYEQVYAQMSDEFKKVVKQQQLADLSEASFQNVKSFQSLNEPIHVDGSHEYHWMSNDGTLGITGVMDDQDQIIALLLQPVERFPESDQQLTKTTYRMPFAGKWFVFWGGHNVMQNYHYAVESQRYAYDFIQNQNGISYKGDPKKNESYYAFGQPALAPAAGKVVSVINDIADNEPVGKMNPKQPGGNTVVIDHGGEYSMLAHLKKGSVMVKVGDSVQTGEQVGEVGNSGNSSEAHMHFQVSDGPDLMENKAIAIRWENDIQPVRGDIVDADRNQMK